MVSIIIFGGVFEVEEGVEKSGGLHEALRLAAFCFTEAELVGHDIAYLIDYNFGDAYLRTDRAEVLINGITGGIKGGFAFFDLFFDEGFVIFAKN